MPIDKKLSIAQQPDNPVKKTVLAQAIVDISKAAKDLANNGLNQKAIVLLISHSSGQSQSAVREILIAIEQLARDYTNLTR
jgi:hypothetical protein